MALDEFVGHYNNERPHRGIDLEVPVAYSTLRAFTNVDGVQRADRLGGLVHEYRVPPLVLGSFRECWARHGVVTGLNVDHSSSVPDALQVLDNSDCPCPTHRIERLHPSGSRTERRAPGASATASPA